MTFEKIFTLNEGLAIPGRLYVSSYGLEVFGGSVDAVKAYSMGELKRYESKLKGNDFFMALGWGFGGTDRALDVFFMILEGGLEE